MPHPIAMPEDAEADRARYLADLIAELRLKIGAEASARVAEKLAAAQDLAERIAAAAGERTQTH